MQQPNRLKWMRPFLRRMNRHIKKMYGQAAGMSGLVLLMITRGRKSGLPRTTPLQYERVDDCYYVAAGWGSQSDWYRNVQANPHVQVQVGSRTFAAVGETCSDCVQVADFLALRLKRHPFMVGLLMRLEGLPLRFERADLERFAANKVMVRIHPAAADTGD